MFCKLCDLQMQIKQHEVYFVNSLHCLPIRIFIKSIRYSDRNIGFRQLFYIYIYNYLEINILFVVYKKQPACIVRNSKLYLEYTLH